MLYSSLLDFNSPRLRTVFKHAMMHLLHVSCREALLHDMQLDFFLADILQSIVRPKGSSDLVWTLKQAKKCNFFFILTSTVWHSSLSACLNSTQRITNYQAPLLLSSLRHTFCSLPFLLMWEDYPCAHNEKKENETLQLNTQSWENWRKLVLSLKFENSPVGEMS